jgi:O-antigen/teichoic acid export membrane protein
MSAELNDIAKASARGSFFLFLGKTSSTIVMALASILVARILGPENYGLYVLAMIPPSFLTTLSNFGISQALIKFCAQFRYERKNRKMISLIKTGMVFNLILSIPLALVLLLFSQGIATWFLRRPGLDLLISFTTVYLIGQMIYSIVESVFIGLDKTEKCSLIMNAQAITKAVASPLLILVMGAVGAILGAGLGVLIGAITGTAVLLLSLRAFDDHSGGENINFNQGLKLMISYGMPIYLSTLIISFLGQYKSFLLALFVSDAEIGNYSIAANFSILLTLISYPIATALFPAFSKLSIKKNRNTLEKMFKLSVKYTSLLIIPTSLAIAVLSREAVYSLYGPQYELAPSYLSLYVLSYLWAGLGMLVWSSFFNGQGDTRTTLLIHLVNLALTVPIAFVMTLLYGVLGQIISLLITDFLFNMYTLFLAHKKYRVTLDWVSFLKTAGASFCSALLVCIFITFASFPNHIFNLAVGGSIYLLSFLTFAPLFKVIHKEDIRNLDEMTKDLTPIYPIAKRILNLEEKILALNVTL